MSSRACMRRRGDAHWAHGGRRPQGRRARGLRALHRGPGAAVQRGAAGNPKTASMRSRCTGVTSAGRRYCRAGGGADYRPRLPRARGGPAAPPGCCQSAPRGLREAALAPQAPAAAASGVPHLAAQLARGGLAALAGALAGRRRVSGRGREAVGVPFPVLGGPDGLVHEGGHVGRAVQPLWACRTAAVGSLGDAVANWSLRGRDGERGCLACAASAWWPGGLWGGFAGHQPRQHGGGAMPERQGPAEGPTGLPTSRALGRGTLGGLRGPPGTGCPHGRPVSAVWRGA